MNQKRIARCPICNDRCSWVYDIDDPDPEARQYRCNNRKCKMAYERHLVNWMKGQTQITEKDRKVVSSGEKDEEYWYESGETDLMEGYK